MISRDDLIDHLRARFEATSYMLAAWQGGSDATGRTDRYSDLDLQVIAEDERTEDCFVALRAALEELGPVDLSYRLPEPAWHGYSQAVMRLSNSDPNHFVDFFVMPASAPPEKRYLEVERHGTPIVWFDRGDFLAPRSLDRGPHEQRMLERRETLRTTMQLFAPLVTRAVARGMPVEAIAFYHRFALQPIVELLRMRHDPDRYDFGLRYLDRDLPDDERAFVESLAFPKDAADVARLHAKALERARELWSDLDG